MFVVTVAKKGKERSHFPLSFSYWYHIFMSANKQGMCNITYFNRKIQVHIYNLERMKREHNEFLENELLQC